MVILNVILCTAAVLKTSEIGQCGVLKLVKNFVLPMAENTFMVREPYSSQLLRSE